MKMKLFVVFSLCLLPALAADPDTTHAAVSVPRFDDLSAMKLYRVSLFAMAGAQAADVASSYGRQELNPILAPGRNNRFGLQAVGIKSALLSSSLVVQSFAIRRNPRLRRPFAIVNFISAAALTAVAVSNSQR